MTFLDQAQALYDQLVADRRDLHQHPELGYEERRTAAKVAQRLRQHGYEVTEGVGETGVVGVIPPRDGQQVVMLRFDMDALPILEANGHAFVSQTPGKMHACGHDGHVAIGLGVAELLARHREQLGGGVKLVFQPAEEGGGGAQRMVDQGVFDELRPDLALGLHIWADLPLGRANVRAGALMAASDDFVIEIVGMGGHGSQPHKTVDAVLVAAQIVVALQSVISRSVDPEQAAVVSVGKIDAGTAFNIIAERAELTGTVRTYDEPTRQLIHTRIREIAEGVAAAFGASASLRFHETCPATVSDPAAAELVRRSAEQVLGVEQVSDAIRSMGSEDMSIFLNEIPGCYFFLGGRNEERGIVYPHHNPRFDFDEACLPYGVAILCDAATRYLRGAE